MVSRRLQTIVGISLVLVLACMHARGSPPMMNDGIYSIPLTLPRSLEPDRATFEETLLSAQRRVHDFAAANGWLSLGYKSFADRAEFFDDKTAYDWMLLRLVGEPESTKLPATLWPPWKNDS